MKPINRSEQEFFQTFLVNLQFIEKYKDTTLLEEALDLVPEEDLRIKATQKLSLLEAEEGESKLNLEDLVLLELLHWFKTSFFTWVDTPKCESCGIVTRQKGIVDPLDVESIWEARKVEEFCCPQCEKTVRFPRYNHPKKLLQTRKGRCGEWANCFTLICLAMGYDARLVWDWSDHVWTEVLSQERNEWVHCDACEEAFDRPLMYELGWKKQLNYVIAFSKFGVQDVTWRYTTNFEATYERRMLVREDYLEHLIWSHTQKLQESLSPPDQQRHAEITFEELITFLKPPTPENADTYEGRSSGSLSWRLARGEILPSGGGGYTFKLFPEEIQEKYFIVKYNCAQNKYVRITNGQSIESEGWDSWVNVQKNIFRKLESDWKKVYLVRTESSDVGKLTWCFDFDGSGLLIEKVCLTLSSRTFETGKVSWELCPTSEKNKSVFLQVDGTSTFTTEAVRGYCGFMLTAVLTQGSGVAAWQHAQLFRQSLDSDTFPFQVEVFFKDKNENIGAETKKS